VSINNGHDCIESEHPPFVDADGNQVKSIIYNSDAIEKKSQKERITKMDSISSP